MNDEIEKLDVNKLIWINFLTVDDLDVDKLKTVPIDFKKLSDVMDKKVVKNTKFNKLNTEVNNLEKKTTTLIHINKYNKDRQSLKKKTGDFDKKNTRR